MPRADYPTLEHCIYLNQASLGLIGRPAVEAMRGFLDDVARHGNRHMSDVDEVAYFDSLREQAALLMQSAIERVAIVGSASELLGQLPYLLDPERGSVVLAVRTDFPALTRPWLRLAIDGGCELRFVDDAPDCNLTDSLIDVLDGRTSVLAVSHVQYATGTTVDLPRLRRATNDVGASLVVDASQAAGAVDVDTAAWDAEVIVSSGYKWLGGHGGVALATVAEQLFASVPPLPGWMGAPEPFDFDATRLLVAPDARRFTQSTMSYISMAGLTAALCQLLALGIPRIDAHARKLAVLLVDDLAALGWRPYRPIEDPAAASHIISIAHPTHSVAAAAVALRDRNIVCGTRSGRIRISLAAYNDQGDVHTLLEALASLE